MKRDLILLHGALGSAVNFDALKEILSNDFTVHAFSFSGHGKTKVDDEFSIKLFEKDLIQFYHKHNIEKAFIFGYSMGGYVAIHFAFENPDKVEKIFTYGTKFDWNPEFALKETAFLNPAKIEEKVPKFAESLRHQYEKNWSNVVEKTASMMIELGKDPVLSDEILNGILVPVKIGFGTKDNMVSKEESIKVSETLKNADFEIFEGWQHPLLFLDLKELAERLKKFFI